MKLCFHEMTTAVKSLFQGSFFWKGDFDLMTSGQIKYRLD